MKENEILYQRKSWDEFQKAGLFWFINRLLHIFGWALIYEQMPAPPEGDYDEIVTVYPARVKYRGFPEAVEEDGFMKLTKHIVDNGQELLKEVTEE